MNKTNLNEKSKMDFMVIGFAIFSMLFGAGNLIFPPFLGFMTGSAWIVGFIGYVLADIILGVSGIMTSLDHDYEKDGAVSISSRVDKKIGLLLGLTMITCIGPAVVIPRTAATTFEISILPLLPNFNPLVFSIIFFLIVIALTITKSKVVDVIGKVLTPILLVSLAILIIKGIATPIGDMSQVPQIENNVFAEGIAQGYQTMDALGAVALAALVMNSIISKGYTNRAEKRKILIKSNAVAAIFLILVYGGLCYIGATASTSLDPEIGQTLLLTTLTHLIMGYWGKVLLAIIVFFACLTTAVGLTSVAAEYYEEVSKGRLSYKVLVVAICAISTVISTVGVSDIIKVAGPLLDIIYPVAVTLIVLTLMSNKIKSNVVFNISAIVACLFGVMNVLKVGFIQSLPLAEVGLSWVIPVLIVSVISIVVTSSKSNKGEKLKDTQIS